MLDPDQCLIFIQDPDHIIPPRYDSLQFTPVKIRVKMRRQRKPFESTAPLYATECSWLSYGISINYLPSFSGLTSLNICNNGESLLPITKNIFTVEM